MHGCCNTIFNHTSMCCFFLQNFCSQHICSQQSLLYYIFYSLFFDHYVVFTHTLCFAQNSDADLKTFLSRVLTFPYRFSADSHCSHMLDFEFCKVWQDVQQVTDPPKQKYSARRRKVERSRSSWLLIWDITRDINLHP